MFFKIGVVKNFAIFTGADPDYKFDFGKALL